MHFTRVKDIPVFWSRERGVNFGAKRDLGRLKKYWPASVLATIVIFYRGVYTTERQISTIVNLAF